MAPEHVTAQLLIALTLSLALLYTARGLRRLARWVARLLSRWIPRRAAVLASTIIVAIGTIFVLNGTVVSFSLRAMNDLYSSVDTEIPAGLTQPTSPERSGSPSSLNSWDGLGRQGRAFVASGPTREDLMVLADQVDAFDRAQVHDPIRVYAGLDDARHLEDTAADVVAELDRTNAWDRSALLVVTSTGTGWVQPAMADTFEYLHGGDTAIASMQYSYLPSWVSFVSDRDTPPAAGRALFEAVYSAWSAQPEDTRPALYIAGLSLGSYGMQGAFSGIQDMTQRADGALFVGTPSFTTTWEVLTEHRDPPSPMITPIIDDGRTVRFSSTPRSSHSLWDLGQDWSNPRIVYLQHASDAVVWWSPDLLWSPPLGCPNQPGSTAASTWCGYLLSHSGKSPSTWHCLVTSPPVTGTSTMVNTSMRGPLSPLLTSGLTKTLTIYETSSLTRGNNTKERPCQSWLRTTTPPKGKLRFSLPFPKHNAGRTPLWSSSSPQPPMTRPCLLTWPI